MTGTIKLDPLAAFRLDGKVALVTGASSGLGARSLACWTPPVPGVALLARRRDRLEQLSAELDDALPLPCDLRSMEAITAAVQTVRERYGHVDVLVNNAGTVDAQPALEEPIDVFSDVIA
jgi:gluconate 5-dehydrogenase